MSASQQARNKELHERIASLESALAAETERVDTLTRYADNILVSRDAALASLKAAEVERDRLRDAFPICHVCKARVGEHHQPFCSVEPGEHTLTHAQFMSESRLAAARADAVREFAEWYDDYEDGKPETEFSEWEGLRGCRVKNAAARFLAATGTGSAENEG
jgi:hypothetical protein